MNKYEINFNREANSIVLERRFSPLQVKRLKSDCTFKIDTKFFGKNAGIYVNIVKMRLRQTKLTGNCIDSITIKHNDDAKKRFCGDLPPGEIKSVEDFKGKVKITVSIDKSVPFSDPDDYVEFQIVATAYKDCQDLDHEFNCKKNVRRSCISSSFVNDSIVNCLEPYCSDERLGCLASSSDTSVIEEQEAVNNMPQIFLSAITSLLLTMLCCGGLFYIVLKIKRCFCPQPTTQTTTTRVHRRRRRRNNQSDGEAPATTPDMTPTAPPKDDLPPSYDALFPERAKPDAPNT